MLKLETQTEKTAKSVNEAKELALSELGLTEAEAEIEIVEEGTKGFLGIGSKDAKVIARVKDIPSYRAKKFLEKIFADMNITVDITTKYDGDNLLIDLSGDNMGIVIGKRGDTLDSLQYLTSLVVNRGNEDYYKVTLDTENYREKRVESLKALSERLADKVAKTGKKYTLEPMNPYERRIIHFNLQNSETVTTYSVGDEPYRKVIIAPKNQPARPYYRSRRTTYSSQEHTTSSYSRPHNTHKHSSYESYANSMAESDSTEE